MCLASIHLVNLLTVTSKWGKPRGAFFEGSQKVQAPHGKGLCYGDNLELLGLRVDLCHKVLTPFARSHNLDHVGGSC
jgi:hypothetical protein